MTGTDNVMSTESALSVQLNVISTDNKARDKEKVKGRGLEESLTLERWPIGALDVLLFLGGCCFPDDMYFEHERGRRIVLFVMLSCSCLALDL